MVLDYFFTIKFVFALKKKKKSDMVLVGTSRKISSVKQIND